VGQERIRLIERIFHNLGYGGLEAHPRTYHVLPPSGYYALAVHESRLTRRRLSAMYTLALSDQRL
jgi:hypothetical protein